MEFSAFHRVATDDKMESLLRVILTANATLDRMMPKPQNRTYPMHNKNYFRN